MWLTAGDPEQLKKAAGDASLRLEGLGLGEHAGDTALLEYCAGLVWDELTANLNRSVIPEKLWRVYVDMACGEYLWRKLASGDLDDLFSDGADGPDPGRVTSVSVGEVSVGLAEGETPRSAFESLIDALRHPRDLRYLLNIFRTALE